MTENSQQEADPTAAPRSSNYEVGYCRPPIATRWPKGVCGNPARIRKKDPKPIATLIDDFFHENVNVPEKGVTRRMSKLEVILRQLLSQAGAGKKGALEVLMLYQAHFAKRNTRRTTRWEFP